AKLVQLARHPRTHRLGVRVRAVGKLDLLPDSVVAAIREAEDATAANRGTVLTIAVAYGGRQEIIDAMQAMLREKAKQGEDLETIIEGISEETLAQYLYTPDLPDPDLIIRTSGEVRLSGFLLWQSAYSEFYFCDVHWPAFRKTDFLGPPDPAHGDVAREPLVDPRVRKRLVGHGRGEPSRGDRVHLDRVAGPLDAERACERDHAALGRGVDRVAGEPHLPQHRGDVDDLARRLRDEVGGRRAATVEGAREVHVHHEAPVRCGHLGERRDLGDARVVDHDVEPAELADGARHQRLDLGVARDVRGHDQGAPTRRLDASRGLLEVFLRARRQGHVGAGPGERDGDRPTEPPAGAGDDGDLVRERQR